MAYNNKSTEQQFVVSKELIQLLRWLVENEPENLKNLVNQALEDGLQEELQPQQPRTENNHEETQQSVIDFFSLLESLLHEVNGGNDEDEHTQSRTMFPALNHIDSNICDHNTLAVSAAKASSQLPEDEEASQADAKEALCKALIKYWKPDKTRFVH